MLALATLAGGPWALDRLRQRGRGLARGVRRTKPLVCSYRLRTGLPCIGCGGTRAFELTSRGEWRAAFATNLLGASTERARGCWPPAAAWCSLRGRTRTLLASAGACAVALLAVLIVQVVVFFWAASARRGRLEARAPVETARSVNEGEGSMRDADLQQKRLVAAAIDVGIAIALWAVFLLISFVLGLG